MHFSCIVIYKDLAPTERSFTVSADHGYSIQRLRVTTFWCKATELSCRQYSIAQTTSVLSKCLAHSAPH
jgi:hypothetical protein